MKKLLFALTTSTTLILSAPAFAAANIDKTYEHLYNQVVHKFNARTPGCNLVNHQCKDKTPSKAQITTSIGVLERMLAPPVTVSTSAPTTTTTTSSTSSVPSVASSSYSSSGGLANVPGVPASFAACVALRESSNGAGSSNIYGILGPGGQGSLAEQKAAFSSMYAASGTQPWAPYDGC